MHIDISPYKSIIFIIPGALLQEVVGEWPLSSSLCISWVFADVFLCTSSILSLTAICIGNVLTNKTQSDHKIVFLGHVDANVSVFR